MEIPDHLQIDLADPQDIRSKLPEARGLHAAKRRQLDELTQQVKYWGELVDLLARLVGEKGPEENRRQGGGLVLTTGSPSRKTAPSQERAIRALEQAGRPMGPAELYRYMSAHDMKVPSSANALGATLWTAVKAGRAKRTSEGLYASLDYSEGGEKEEPSSSDSGALPTLSENGEGPSTVTTDPSQSRA